MKLFVIGGGGREHALVWKLNKSPLVNKIYCAPGNAGIARQAECVDIAVDDVRGLLKFAIRNKIDLTIVGPEAPLIAGVVDEFEKNNVAIFGPTQRAAQLEGSKSFTKYLLDKYRIPTAQFKVFTQAEEAKRFVKNSPGPLVVKADGLAAGKGVIVCQNQEQALEAVQLIMETRALGDAGNKLVIEECLVGPELSVLALSDGEHLVYMMPSQDHKRIFDGDQGPNTGGMGAYAPTPYVDTGLMERIKKEIMEPTIKGMALEDRPYKGVLYAGLMITAEGPKVLEYNCRFGDPETQVVLPMAKSDLVEALLAAREGKLAGYKWQNYCAAAVCVVIASGGYPGQYEKGKPIYGLDGPFEDGLMVFHAGTARSDGNIVTAGGRVLGITALDTDIEKAIHKAYRGVGKITFDGAYYRKDIAAKALV